MLLIFFNKNCALHLHDLYKPSGQNQVYKIFQFKTKASSMYSGQNTLSYLTPTVWNNFPTCLKLSNTRNSFRHNVKEHFRNLKNKEQDIFAD